MAFSVLALVLRRSLAHWKLLAVVVVGVIVAAGLTASTAIYSDAVRDLGLSYAIRQVPKLALDLDVENGTQAMRPREDGIRRQTVQGTVRGYAGKWIGGSVEYGKSATFFLTPPGQPVPADDQRPRSFFQYVDDLPAHVRVTDGTLKLHTDPPSDPTTPPTVNVVVGKQAADSFAIHVGDRFDTHPFWHLDRPPVTVVVGGIVEPKDLSEEYWFGKTDRFAYSSTTWRTYPFFVDQATMTQVLAGYLPDLSADISTFFFVKTGGIDSNNSTRADQGFRAAMTQISRQVERTTSSSVLPDTIETYRQKLFFTRLPLFALIMQVVGIVLYYIVMVSTMLVDRQAGEIALLKSRGASTLQVLVVYAIEGGIVAALGVALGPPLASAVVKLLGPTPPFHALSAGHLLSTHISVQAIWLALAGSLLSLAALLVPAFRASRLSMVQYRQTTARPAPGSLFTRYYLDVFLIVAGGLLFYELRERGSLVTKQVFGGLKADPLLLVTPALFTLMVALLFLRLFPLLLRLVAAAVGQVSSTSVLLGLWHMVRSPVHYSRLILLLILATSLGMFAAGFRATLDRSYNDRARYEAGAPLRVEGIHEPSTLSPGELAGRVRSLTGAQTASPVMRTNASYTLKQFNELDADLLAIDPATFGSVAYWRGDFSGRSMQSIEKTLAKSAPAQPAGIALPDGARWLGVWVKTATAANGYVLVARLSDRTGRVLDYGLNSDGGPQPVPGDWSFFYASLLQPTGGSFRQSLPPPSQPLRFLSLYVRSRGALQSETITDYFDDLQVSTAAALQTGPTGFADPAVVDDFEQAGGLEPIDGLALKPTADTYSRSEQTAHGGKASGQLVWTRDRGGAAIHGVRVQSDGQPIDVFVDDSFLKASGLHSGQTGRVYTKGMYVTVRIAGSFSYFPAFRPDSGHHLLVADLDRVQYEINRTPGGSDFAAANAVWASGAFGDAPDAALKQAGFSADEYVSLGQILAAQQRDPLIAASWEGILFLAFAAALILTALGFLVYSYLTARSRSLEFAVLRTMGLSTLQIVAIVSFEQLFVVGAGVITGTVLGMPLSRLMIGYMGVTETGQTVVPPFVSSVSWQAVVTSYLGIALVLIAAVSSLVLLYARLSVTRELRMGEA